MGQKSVMKDNLIKGLKAYNDHYIYLEDLTSVFNDLQKTH